MSKHVLAVVALFAFFAVAAPAQASPGALKVLVTGNSIFDVTPLETEIEAQPGVASADSFDTSVATPEAAALADYDLIVSMGDYQYFDQATWGNRLADFADAGGAVLQMGWDNWDDSGSFPNPTGRFASGGYAPLSLGPDLTSPVALGTIAIPGHPLLAGLGTFPNTLFSGSGLAPGATLVASWNNGYAAIAYKGRVAGTGAAQNDKTYYPSIARLALNTGIYLGRHNLTVSRSGTGTGTVDGGASGINCGTTCSKLLASGTKVTLTPVAAKGSQFKGWTGACTGTSTCETTIAGAELGVGAVFDIATFGSKTAVSLSKSSSKAGKLKIKLRNKNDFVVKGSVSGRTASGKVLKLKSKSVTIGASSSKTVELKLTRALKGLLAKRGSLKLAVAAKLKDPNGKSRTVKKTLTVKM